MNELLNIMEEEREIIEELIKIDNEIMRTNYDFDYYYQVISRALEMGFESKVIDQDVVFVTEGDLYITMQLILKAGVGANRVIFINQGFVGMNKWLVSKYNEITGDDTLILDTDINYNKYIDKGFKVVPIGEETLIDQVLEDFYA